MIRALAVTPIHVDDEEIARRQARYDRLAGVDMAVELRDVGAGDDVPRALETEDDIAASEGAVMRWFANADVDGFDVLLPDCVLDPGVATPAAAELPRPLHGIARLTGHWLAGLGHRVGAVARNEVIAAELDRKLASYGLELYHPTSVLGLAVEDISDEETWLAAALGTVTRLGVDSVVNACSAVEVTQQAVGPRLVDPTAAALVLLRLGVDQ